MGLVGGNKGGLIGGDNGSTTGSSRCYEECELQELIDELQELIDCDRLARERWGMFAVGFAVGVLTMLIIVAAVMSL